MQKGGYNEYLRTFPAGMLNFGADITGGDRDDPATLLSPLPLPPPLPLLNVFVGNGLAPPGRLGGVGADMALE